MRLLILAFCTLFFAACDSASEGEGNANNAGGGNAPGQGGAGGGGPSGEGGASEGGAFLQCTGDTQTIPAGSGLGLTQETATTMLQGTWAISLLPIQEKCLHAIEVGMQGEAAVQASTVLNPDTDKDLIDMAMLLASQTDYAITDANEVKEALSKELPNMTMEIGEGTIKVSGDNSFDGSLVVDSAKDDQVQVTRSAGGILKVSQLLCIGKHDLCA